MTFKHAVKTSAYAIGTFVFPTIRPRVEEKPFDVEAHIAAVQASFRAAVKDDLK